MSYRKFLVKVVDKKDPSGYREFICGGELTDTCEDVRQALVSVYIVVNVWREPDSFVELREQGLGNF